MEGSSFRPGDRFLSFNIVRLLGRGGIGEVYEIVYNGNAYALKIVQTQWMSGDAQRRLIREGEFLALLSHPNIVNVHDTGITRDGVAWYRMELLHGLTLREVLRHHGALPLPVACAVLRQAAHGAHQCHAMGAVHRDIKPENLFVTVDNTVKLLDFGIAKLYGCPDTLDAQTHGTPLYMSPEQLRGGAVTPATDVYAIGLIAYEVLTGAHPFHDDAHGYNLCTVLAHQLLTEPPSLTLRGIPEEIAALVSAAVAKDPCRRPQDGLALADAIWNAWKSIERRNIRPILPALEPASSPAHVVGDEQVTSTFTASTVRDLLSRPHPGPVRTFKTELLPDIFRDPTCIAALEGRLPLAQVPAQATPLTGWVPVSSTEALAPTARRAPGRRRARPSRAPGLRRQLAVVVAGYLGTTLALALAGLGLWRARSATSDAGVAVKVGSSTGSRGAGEIPWSDGGSSLWAPPADAGTLEPPGDGSAVDASPGAAPSTSAAGPHGASRPAPSAPRGGRR